MQIISDLVSHNAKDNQATSWDKRVVPKLAKAKRRRFIRVFGHSVTRPTKRFHTTHKLGIGTFRKCG